MKCFVLAGGTGDTLWPLSRHKYPKQFIHFNKGRSLFQETIARNMSYCDEFFIITQQDFQFIVEEQLIAFQGLKYRLFVESSGHRTGPSLALTAMFCDPDEVVMVITSDHLLVGASYAEFVMEAKDIAQTGRIVTQVMEPQKASSRFSYLKWDPASERVTEFIYRPPIEVSARFFSSGDYCWNMGILTFRIQDFLKELELCSPELYTACEQNIHLAAEKDGVVFFPPALMSGLPMISIDEVLLSKTDKLYALKCDYAWRDIGSLRAYDKYALDSDKENIILHHCQDTTVINHTSDRLVVVNGISDAIIVNTDDALYITNRDTADQIKQIAAEHKDEYRDYFDNNTRFYHVWGMNEILSRQDNCLVNKITISPGMVTDFPIDESRTAQWFLVNGTAEITLGATTREYHPGESLSFSMGIPHSASNPTDNPITIMEVSIEQALTGSHADKLAQAPGIADPASAPCEFVKMAPAFKDYLWGGTRIKTELKKRCPLDTVAESWELSAHPDGMASISGGQYDGMPFQDYLNIIGKEALGWKCTHYDRFPLLIKFIDAAKPLSVQIHPGDDYALTHEKEYGKNEMWYVMDCAKDSYIYYGLNREISKAELRKRIRENTLLEVLNKVPVQKGDSFFVEAGTIHAIGAGILICEIQQNSNCTYRMYDYNRRDKFNKRRPLHIRKSLAVVNTEPMEAAATREWKPEPLKDNATEEVLCRCKYFETVKYSVADTLDLPIDSTSFHAVVITKGHGSLTVESHSASFRMGDCFFIPAGDKKLHISGRCEVLITHV